MAWSQGMSLAIANRLLLPYSISVTFDNETRIYTAKSKDKSIQRTSVVATFEAILREWFTHQ